MLRQIRTSILLLFSLTLLTGMLYPLLVTGISQLIFPSQANGSLIGQDGLWVGSELIGQSFTSPGYFRGRPSATSPVPYNAAASSGSNLGPSNPVLLNAVHERVEYLQGEDSYHGESIPVDLVTSSGSGLDPHISVQAAFYQIPRVARVRGIPERELRTLVERSLEPRDLGVLGEPRVNVLLLNLALDRSKSISKGDR